MGDNRNTEDLNVAIVGLGYWGPNLLRVVAEMEGVQVAWICDLDRSRLERFGRRYPGALATTRADDVFEDPAVDVVVIATPVFTHFDMAARSLRAGKHTFVEKPLAPSREEADRLAALAVEADLMLMCGHTFVHSPPVRAVKGLLDRRELGDLYFLTSSRVNLGLHQRDVSVIWDLGSHDFSILLYWLDEMPESVRAVGRDSIVPGIPDVAFVTLKFASGIVANVELSWLAPSKLRRTVVVGSEKMVVYEDMSPEPIRVFDHGVVYEDPETFGQYQLSYRTGDVVAPKVDTYEPLAVQLMAFFSAIRAGSRLSSHLLLARRVVQLAEAADESLRQGGREIALGPVRRFSSAGASRAFQERIRRAREPV